MPRVLLTSFAMLSYLTLIPLPSAASELLIDAVDFDDACTKPARHVPGRRALRRARECGRRLCSGRAASRCAARSARDRARGRRRRRAGVLGRPDLTQLAVFVKILTVVRFACGLKHNTVVYFQCRDTMVLCRGRNTARQDDP